jgi:hypothetical protein
LRKDRTKAFLLLKQKISYVNDPAKRFEAKTNAIDFESFGGPPKLAALNNNYTTARYFYSIIILVAKENPTISLTRPDIITP